MAQKKKKHQNKKSEKSVKIFDFDKIQWFILALGIIFNIIVRVGQIDMPLERDEGEYGYQAQLILQGHAPWDGAYNKKLPGVSFCYALGIGLMGNTSQAIKAELIIVNALNILFLFLLSRKLFGSFVASLTSLVYSLMSVDPGVLGNAAHATHYINLFALPGLLLLLKYRETKKINHLFFGGLLLGLAFTMKQHALFLLLFGFLYLIYITIQDKDIKADKKVMRIALFISGLILPYLIIVFIVLFGKTFDRFWFWTVTISKDYGSKEGIADFFHNIRINFLLVVSFTKIIWFISLIGLIIFISAKQYGREIKIFILCYLLFAIFSIMPGYVFRTHYFVVILPLVSIFTAITIDYLSNKTNLRKVPNISLIGLAILVVILSLNIPELKNYYFPVDANLLARQNYGVNPFADAVTISDHIRSNTTDKDFIYVLGSEPEIYYLSDRKSASNYILTYDLVDGNPLNLKMQKEMIYDIEQKKPKFVVLVNIPFSWLAFSNKITNNIYTWWNDYQKKYYLLEGIVSLSEDGLRSLVKWGDGIREFKELSNNNVFIFKRID